MTERDVFIAALQKDDPAGRQAYLDEACAGRPELRRQVELLLRLHEGAGGFLEKPAAEPPVTGPVQGAADQAAAPEAPGTVIGPYKLIEEIGEGGMGKVWMAQQTEPVKRLVAVKLIKAGMDSRQVVARFEAERQALALMDHPNIARVLDAGATGAGRPFFVMDLVKGAPITRYCDEHRLTPRQRLELFMPVCQAVQHAHQKGVIHRDLKPSNVLVAPYDGKPVPKVIDFGVAKAAGQPLTDRTLVTGFGAIVGTLEYMSPEQAEVNQLDVDTRSDIYSLGVLLYELLTGSPPFAHKESEKDGLLEMLRVIREQEPTKPSAKLSTAEGLPTLAANRGTEPAKLTKLVRGELDWIVMKALEKDRNRRYETANGFAMDVQRYLADEPVQACPPSAGYRLRKFARRNKRVLASAAVVALTVSLVTTVSIAAIWSEKNDAVAARKVADEKSRDATSALQSASEQRNLALETLNDLTFTIQEEIRESEESRQLTNDRGGERIEELRAIRQLRQKVLDQAVAGLQRVERSADNAGTLDESMAEARVRMGDIYLHVGKRDEAARQFELARGLAEAWVSYSSHHARAARELALAHRGLGDVHAWWRDFPAGNQHYEQSVQLLEPLAAADLPTADIQHDLSDVYRRLARASASQPNRVRACEYYRKSLEHLEPWTVANPDNVGGRLDLYDACLNLGKLSDDASARDYLEKALQIAQAMVAAHPESFESQYKLWNAYCLLGRVAQDQGELAAARDYCRKAVQLSDVKLRGGWAAVHCDIMTLGEYRQLEEITFRLGDVAEARDCCEQAVRVRERWIAREPGSSEKLKAHLADDYTNLAWLLAACPDEKARDPKQAVELAKRAVEIGSNDSMAWQYLGWIQYRTGDWRSSIEALEMSCKWQEGGTGDAGQWIVLALAHARLAAQENLPGKEREQHRAEARRRFDQADREIDRWGPTRPGGAIDQAICDFRAEARELIGVKEKRE